MGVDGVARVDRDRDQLPPRPGPGDHVNDGPAHPGGVYHERSLGQGRACRHFGQVLHDLRIWRTKLPAVEVANGVIPHGAGLILGPAVFRFLDDT